MYTFSSAYELCNSYSSYKPELCTAVYKHDSDATFQQISIFHAGIFVVNFDRPLFHSPWFVLTLNEKICCFIFEALKHIYCTCRFTNFPFEPFFMSHHLRDLDDDSVFHCADCLHIR